MGFKEHSHETGGIFKPISPPIPIIRPYHLQLGIMNYDGVFSFDYDDENEVLTDDDLKERGYVLTDGVWTQSEELYYAFIFLYPKLYMNHDYTFPPNDEFPPPYQKVFVLEKKDSELHASEIHAKLVKWIQFHLHSFGVEDIDVYQIGACIRKVLEKRDENQSWNKSRFIMMINNDSNPKRRLKREKMKVKIYRAVRIVGLILFVIALLASFIFWGPWL